MPKLTINGTEIEVEPGTSIIQAAEQVGVEIPRFCYHEKLSVPANCRMCLVEVKGGPPKPVASCAMACVDGMVVETESDMVHRARKSVMEFLLINHPLDCPICDQGGECDLQDQAAAYGYDRSRYTEDKRAVSDKNLGPLVKTVMTRCIQCTRCIRFGEEVAGVPALGLMNRGEDVEIGTYVERMMDSELSGNLIDVCPVGALLSKPYAFTARPWELRKTETIDVTDAVGSAIRVDSKGREVMRILPRLNDSLNEVWISDKARFSYDGLARRRLDRPWVRNAQTGRLEPAGWDDALSAISERVAETAPGKMAVFAGDQAEMESLFALRQWMTAIGCDSLECRVDGADFNPSDAYGYLFNGRIESLDQADAILLIGVDPRREAAIVNMRIHKAVRENRSKVGLIGPACDLNYAYDHLGSGPQDLEALAKARSGFAKIMKDARNAVVIVGTGVMRRRDARAVQGLALALADKWGASYNFLHLAAGRVGALTLGFYPPNGTKPLSAKGKKFVWLHGVDNDAVLKTIDSDAFVVYQGHHGDAGAHRADVILPGCAYTEKSARYMNTEGCLQTGLKAVSPPGEAREDWQIVTLAAKRSGVDLGYTSVHDLRAAMDAQAGLCRPGEYMRAERRGVDSLAVGPIEAKPFTLPVQDFYRTCAITRASDTMTECARAFSRSRKRVEAA